MNGIFLAVVATIILSCGDAGKKLLVHRFDKYFVIWITCTIGLVINFGYISIVGLSAINWPEILFPLCIAAACGMLGEILFMLAVRNGEFSVIMPLGAFSPIFSTVLAFLIFGEMPSSPACAGILLTVIGAYLLFTDLNYPKKILKPLRALFSELGPRYMLLGTLTFALIVNYQKMGAQLSTPVIFFTLVLVCQYPIYTLILIRKGINPVREFSQAPLLCVLTGILWGVGLTMTYASFSYTLVAYAAAIKQLGLVVAIGLGYLIFKEKQIQQRIVSTFIMIAGVTLIILGAR